MTKKRKQKATRQDVMIARLWTLTMPQGPMPFDEEFKWIIEMESGQLADAIEYMIAKPERHGWISEIFQSADINAESPSQATFVRRAWPRVVELLDTTVELGNDAHEAFYRLYGHRTWEHKRREKRGAEKLASVAHLTKCLEL